MFISPQPCAGLRIFPMTAAAEFVPRKPLKPGAEKHVTSTLASPGSSLHAPTPMPAPWKQKELSVLETRLLWTPAGAGRLTSVLRLPLECGL